MPIDQTKLRAAWTLLIVMSIALLVEASFPSTVPEHNISHFDKALHFLAYGTLAWLTIYVLIKSKIADIKYPYIISVVYILLLGIATESIQSFTPGRDASIDDIIADLIGAVFFLLIFKQQFKAN
jgi:VanZ family protein